MRKFDFNSYLAAIHHDGSKRYAYTSHGNDPKLNDLVTLRLRTAPQSPIERILLRFCPDGEQQFIEMSQEFTPSSREACTWWRAQLKLNMPLTSYRFLIFTEDGPWWYNAAGLQRGAPTDAQDFRLLAGYAAPAWVRNSVFYQIFPDRFADGNPGNNVQDDEYIYRGQPSRSRRWGEPLTQNSPTAMVEFFGGDLAGIEQHMDYLQDLGINAIYLNPIFTACSNHRYDVIDYTQVDPHLGGNAALISLRTTTTHHDIRLILDIVPNHCGVLHPWFQQAIQDPHAPSAEYFTFFHHPDDYAAWLGVHSLPKLNYRSQILRQVMYAGPQAIFRHWLRPPYAIDGWRIDVANMLARQGADQLGIEIGSGIRQAVKEENPQAYLLGEHFFDGSSQLQGDIWDATMNYTGFAKPLWYWLSHFYIFQHHQPHYVASSTPYETQALVDTWENFRAAIPWVIVRQQFNLLGSHDTSRILTVVHGNSALNRLAAGILMTYPGVPCILYGDELGLQGEGDSTRQCMPWDTTHWDHELRLFYQTLIHLRRTSPALIHGGFQILAIETDTLAYLRDAEEEKLIIVAHRGPQARPAETIPVKQAAIPNGTTFVELFSQRQTTVKNGHLPLASMSPGIEIWRT